MSDALRRLVMQHAGMGEIESRSARGEGMRTMYEDGLAEGAAGADDDRGSAARVYRGVMES